MATHVSPRNATGKSRRLAGLLALSSLLFVGCGNRAPASSVTQARGASHAAMLEQRHLDARPAVAAITRSGDPRPGLALAFAVDAKLDEILGLSAVLSVRLQKLTPLGEVLPRIDTIAIVGSPSTLAEATAFVAQIDLAIRSEVRPEELTNPLFRENFLRLSQSVHIADLDRARSGCLGDPPRSVPFETLADTDRAKLLEESRRRVFQEQKARWGIAGSDRVVDAIVRAVESAPAWPSVTATDRLSPLKNSVTFRRGILSLVALEIRASRADHSFALARELSEPRSDLRIMLANRFPGLRVETVHAFALVHGGCLQANVVGDTASDALSERELISAVRAILATRSRIYDSSAGATVQVALEQTDASRAALLAAEAALNQPSATVLDQVSVGVETRANLMAHAAGETVKSEELFDSQANTAFAFQKLVRVENGQGQIHALLATSLLPGFEPKRGVGAMSLLLGSAAERHTGEEGVALTPWISPDGAGLLASTGKRDRAETSHEQAARLGRVLGRALTSMPLDTDFIWRERSAALARLGKAPRPALEQALLALAPDHPGLVSPQGLYSTIEATNPLELRARGLHWLAQELRLAVLANDGASMADDVERSIASYLAPYRYDAKHWVTDAIEPARTGDTTVEVPSRDSVDAAFTVCLRLPSGQGLPAIYADWLLRLLTADSGVLSRWTSERKLFSRFDAVIVGGPRLRGLILAGGVPGVSPISELNAIKSLLAELATGSEPKEVSFDELQRWSRERQFRRLSNPRQRLIDLWLNDAPAPSPDEAGFRAYLRSAFAGADVMIVRATPKPEKPELPRPKSVKSTGLTNGKSRTRGSSVMRP